MNITNIIIPRAVTSQGLIASAKTYRLVFNEGGLHIIHLGRAMGMKAQSGEKIADALATKLAGKFEQGLEAQLAAVEKEIADVPLSALVRRKRSFQVALREKDTVTALIKDGEPPRLIVKASGGRIKLIGPLDHTSDFEFIAQSFSSQS